MSEPFLLAQGTEPILFNPAMANRHGLIAGATGTGKTVTLRVLTEAFSQMGVPVFMADVKGDLSGLAQPGSGDPKMQERAQKMNLAYQPQGFPVVFWDVFGKNGHPVRTTISEMGPLLLSRLLNLNDTQAGVLNLAFRVADDNGLLLLDLEDLRSLLRFVGENAGTLTMFYGNVSAASIGAIQRSLLALEEQGGQQLFGEPAINLADFLQTDTQGRGVINLLAAESLVKNPRSYAALLLWLLSELFEELPEVGDMAKPKLVFFFDEAHLLFADLPRALHEKIEQVVRLIRSKGVGIYFISQNPLDLPETILGQLGNRVQHALRAFTPRDQKAVRAAAETFRQNPGLHVESALTELAVGEALVSLLDEHGQPGKVQRAKIRPPESHLAPLKPEERQAQIRQSALFGTYEEAVNRESAAEILAKRATERLPDQAAKSAAEPQGGSLSELILGGVGPRGGKKEGLLESAARSALRSVGSSLGREIVRGLLGTIFGGTKRR